MGNEGGDRELQKILMRSFGRKLRHGGLHRVKKLSVMRKKSVEDIKGKRKEDKQGGAPAFVEKEKKVKDIERR